MQKSAVRFVPSGFLQSTAWLLNRKNGFIGYATPLFLDAKKALLHK